jgi:uncharacterized phage protein gp47/JayE
MAGVTDTGFVRKTRDEIKQEMIAELRRTISEQLVLDETTALGQVVDTESNELSEIWELLEEAYYAFDPDNAIGQQLVALAQLTGTYRRAPTRGAVIATVNLDGGITFPAGSLVAHEDGNSANRWYNLNDITTPAGSAANYDVNYVSEDFGTNTNVAAGKLTAIAETAIGWNSITNAAAAVPGNNEETIEELRARREVELARAGSATLRAIVADVSALAGVLDVVGFENTTEATVDDIGPHGVRIILWDGDPPTVADNDIAQALHDSRAAGILSYGADSGNAQAYDGTSVSEAFDRADEKVVEVNAVISSSSGVTIADVRAAILNTFGAVNTAGTDARSTIGADVVYNALIGAPFDVEGVDDVTTFQIRFTGDAWGTVNLTVDIAEIATLASGDITVTGDVS